MTITFGREICGHRATAESREWIVTNGIGGYASGTVAGLLTRRYHGLLVAALRPPLGRTLLVTKLDETVAYAGHRYPMSANRWADGTVDPQGYHFLESFSLEGTLPVWQYTWGDARLEKRIWMAAGANTTYIRYRLMRATQPLSLTLKGLVNYRDYHSSTQAQGWQMTLLPLTQGVEIQAFEGATPFYLWADRGEITPVQAWHYGFDLALERYRGLPAVEDHLQVATIETTLTVGESLTVVATTDADSSLAGAEALRQRQRSEEVLIKCWQESLPEKTTAPAWIQQLVLAADQFVVNRAQGKSIIAGYPWFGDWGRDTMISLPGLTLATGRPEIAGSILRTFAQYVDQGMLPNRFPDAGETPEYNTVDATLWYFEAVRLYYQATQDDKLIADLFPVLAEIIDWHSRGTRYQIHLDPTDGLLYAGEPGVQLTWMDAKVGDWVVTPRIGKPIEVNALWYSALRTLAQLARQLHKPHQKYEAMANRTQARFTRFWNPTAGYCYDVLDGPAGHEADLRPNQLLAVSLPMLWGNGHRLLSPPQAKQVVDVCGRVLLTSYGLRSQSPDSPQYQGHYGGDQRQRDGAYHQGTTWSWLIGPFVLAHHHVYQDPVQTQALLAPLAHHLRDHGLGTISEIFDGDAPFIPRGCIAQAWGVAEVLRAWRMSL
ncbi:amylo-alpha-1,6-glucosidase [Lyngbya confervoides]|uniref:Amylo-alpha-1,6-glucosidase n=1 Tax=Lyngbya confervoides BDU141951 TaxID=1574623 RepID=A0ABD4SWP6_9CYAN|nr:amylo-alpha-1,6-glucosidase [Lyngbya confervoides]MCM1981226.1 amylo-alpha-1,6-glucosidase [Lyngbya confervoides BDU141951]